MELLGGGDLVGLGNLEPVAHPLDSFLVAGLLLAGRWAEKWTRLGPCPRGLSVRERL